MTPTASARRKSGSARNTVPAKEASTRWVPARSCESLNCCRRSVIAISATLHAASPV